MEHLAAFNVGEQSKPFRDKVAKSIQYFAKTLAEYRDEDHGKKSLLALASNLGLARRLYRWGQVSLSLEILLKHFNYYNNSIDFWKKTILFVTLMISQAFDMLCYIQMILFLPKQADKSSYNSQSFFIVSCGIELYDIFGQLIMAIREYNDEDSYRDRKMALRRIIITATLNGIKKICDGFTALRDVFPDKFSKYRVAGSLAGFTSGVIGVSQLVPALYLVNINNSTVGIEFSQKKHKNRKLGL